MSRPRTELSKKFHEICDNVYFQAPRDSRMVYPCIKYELAKPSVKHANNNIYKLTKCYTVTYITKDPDDPMIEGLLYSFKSIKMDRAPYKSDNLYHCVYELYF